MNASKTEQKQVFIKPYTQIPELEKAIKTIREMDFDKMVISVIGNLGEDNIAEREKWMFQEKKLKAFFKELLGMHTEFDTFYNPELGRLFVAGFLVSTFSNLIGKKAIGGLFGGPFGILRGLGISESEASLDIEKLKNGDSFLVARGDRLNIEILKNKIKNIV